MGRAGDSNGAPAGSTSERSTVQSATGDLWSAFEADRASSLTTDGSASAAPTTGPGTGFGVGVALLGFGAATLLGGLAFAGTRRRRSLASASKR